MHGLSQETQLICNPEASFRVVERAKLEAQVGSQRILCGPYGLEILAAFARPCTLEQALQTIRVKGTQDWIDLSTTVLQLLQRGVLREVSASKAPLQPELPSGFGAWPIHVAMLNDRSRTGGYLAAIAGTVKPGDVVIDLGTGSGVMALAAARAGAAKVYAIEATRMGAVAREVFASHGFADRIELVEGWSTRVELPEKADVVISELIGNDPFCERVLETLTDARQRLLKPGGRFLPERLRVFALPLTIPEVELVRHLGSPQTLATWQAWYDLDFTPLADWIRASELPLFFVKPQEMAAWPCLAAPVLLTEVDFNGAFNPTVEAFSRFTTAAPGLLNGVLVFFELELGSGHRLSTAPDRVDPANCWSSPVWVLDPPLQLPAGATVGLGYHYGGQGRASTLEILYPPGAGSRDPSRAG